MCNCYEEGSNGLVQVAVDCGGRKIDKINKRHPSLFVCLYVVHEKKWSAEEFFSFVCAAARQCDEYIMYVYIKCFLVVVVHGLHKILFT